MQGEAVVAYPNLREVILIVGTSRSMSRSRRSSPVPTATCSASMPSARAGDRASSGRLARHHTAAGDRLPRAAALRGLAAFCRRDPATDISARAWPRRLRRPGQLIACLKSLTNTWRAVDHTVPPTVPVGQAYGGATAEEIAFAELARVAAARRPRSGSGQLRRMPSGSPSLGW
jgi:hypothetical protein